MKGAHAILPVCVKNTSADNWRMGGKSTPLWLLWRPGKGHVLALRPALILACLYFLYEVSLPFCSGVHFWQVSPDWPSGTERWLSVVCGPVRAPAVSLRQSWAMQPWFRGEPLQGTVKPSSRRWDGTHRAIKGTAFHCFLLIEARLETKTGKRLEDKIMVQWNKGNPKSLFGGHRLTCNLLLNLSRQRRLLVIISPWGVGCFRLHCDFCFSL